MQYEFRNVRVGDVSLAYVEQGRGLPVIFVHGSGPTDLRTWGLQIGPFAENFRVIAYSQRYHYPNAWMGDGSDINSTFVDAGDLAALIGELHLGRVHLIGSSYGADVVLRLAVERPDLVRTLVLGEPGLPTWLVTLPGGERLFAELTGTMIPAKRAVQNGDLELGARLFIDAVLGDGLFDQLPSSTKSRIMDNVRLIGAEPTDISESVTDITRDDAATIRAPTLILTGDQSPEMYLLVSQELARYLPNAEQAQIGGAAHVLHYMNAQAYNATVLAFLAKHTS
jgi:pimeloyl-ACP methyl ester carboxylesterase